MDRLLGGIYRGKTVLVTGHTGFKGSWLSLWLYQMGAKVIGYALEPSTAPSHFDLLKLDIVSVIGDIRDPQKLKETFECYQPDIVFHLAAQPLVRHSYAHPTLTFETNIMGSVNVFEACRKTPSVRAIVNITSDKCYENREWVWGYRENDPMGGYDPYSASKGAVELVASSYRNSFFNNQTYGEQHHTLLASCRAGNVIGGGDWSEDRLIPDIIKAALKGEKVVIRNPHATRPWQHVLEPLYGYLMIGQKLLEGDVRFAEGWNFGPDDSENLRVEELLQKAKYSWSAIDYVVTADPNQLHEAHLLKLDCSKARSLLQWNPVFDADRSIAMAVEWYRAFFEDSALLSSQQLKAFVRELA